MILPILSRSGIVFSPFVCFELIEDRSDVTALRREYAWSVLRYLVRDTIAVSITVGVEGHDVPSITSVRM